MTYIIGGNGLISSFSNLRVSSGDLILVQRGNQSYKCPVDELSRIHSDDYILVELAGQSYKLQWADVPDANTSAQLLVSRLILDVGWQSFRAPLGYLQGIDDTRTSEIVGVNYISTPISTAGSTNCLNPQNAFDGNTGTAALTAFTPTTGILQITPTIPVESTDSLEVYCSLGATGSQVGGTLGIYFLNGTVDITQRIKNAGAFAPGFAWVDVSGLVTELTSVSMTSISGVSNPSLAAVRKNGVIITSLDTAVLTLDTTQGLDLFDPGDFVYQNNASGTPLMPSGTVLSVDIGAQTMTLRDVNEDAMAGQGWSANTGNYVDK